MVPAGIPHLPFREVMDFDARAWRREYERCRPSWGRTIRDGCERYAFPEGAFELLSLELMVASQSVLGCLGFLEAHHPSVILTEYDRNRLWSCLVLAARKLGIPSLTLVHGVIERDAFGFSPVLADHILCWGELDRAKLIDAGEAPSTVTVAGCPRLNRHLPSPSLEGRRRLGIDHDGPVAMLATSPESTRFELAEAFCTAIEQLPGMSGVVRLHPSEDLTSYQTMIVRHPTISFVENGRASSDEALAATDVVVVRASGFGSDALVKRKPVVVLSPDQKPTGHDLDLIELAGCPHAHDADELAAVLGRIAQDPAFRAEREIAAERSSRDSARPSETSRRTSPRLRFARRPIGAIARASPRRRAVVPTHVVDKLRALVLGLGLSKLRIRGRALVLHRTAKLTPARPAAAGRADPGRGLAAVDRGRDGRGQPGDRVPVAAPIPVRGPGGPRGPLVATAPATARPSAIERCAGSCLPVAGCVSGRTASVRFWAIHAQPCTASSAGTATAGSPTPTGSLARPSATSASSLASSSTST